jgi:hypothetical protein
MMVCISSPHGDGGLKACWVWVRQQAAASRDYLRPNARTAGDFSY